MNIQEKSRQEFEAWWKTYHKGQPGKMRAWQAWEFGRGIGYQKGWADYRLSSKK